MNKVLVTGGCGYIGSNTMVDLVENGYEVISIDNLSRGFEELCENAGTIAGKPIKNYKVDLCNLEDVRAVFQENPDIVGVIHFAAYILVEESVRKPLEYFRNNLTSLLNVLQCIREFDVKNFVFSSSCSVYGNAEVLPVSEKNELQPAESPYARTKQMGEDICRDFSKANPGHNIILLRYFNPVGAHPSGLLGEMNEGTHHILPIITETAIGKREKMMVFGHDYHTKDGSCVRDYIHVMDVASAHTLALKKAGEGALEHKVEVFNLGSGEGVSVLALIHAFEKVTGKKLNYELADRRPGDVEAIYADTTKARKVLGWKPVYSIEDMVKSAWKWEQHMDAYRKQQKAAFN